MWKNAAEGLAASVVRATISNEGGVPTKRRTLEVEVLLKSRVPPTVAARAVRTAVHEYQVHPVDGWVVASDGVRGFLWTRQGSDLALRAARTLSLVALSILERVAGLRGVMLEEVMARLLSEAQARDKKRQGELFGAKS